MLKLQQLPHYSVECSLIDLIGSRKNNFKKNKKKQQYSHISFKSIQSRNMLKIPNTLNVTVTYSNDTDLIIDFGNDVFMQPVP